MLKAVRINILLLPSLADLEMNSSNPVPIAPRHLKSSSYWQNLSRSLIVAVLRESLDLGTAVFHQLYMQCMKSVFQKRSSF